MTTTVTIILSLLTGTGVGLILGALIAAAGAAAAEPRQMHLVLAKLAGHPEVVFASDDEWVAQHVRKRLTDRGLDAWVDLAWPEWSGVVDELSSDQRGASDAAS